jgi:sugar phosphate isomerase/epimerase
LISIERTDRVTLASNRRRWLAGVAASTTGLVAASRSTWAGPLRDETAAADAPFRFGLNTSTIRGQKLSLVDEIELAARVGYDGIEPWVPELDQFVKDGGSLKDLGKRLKDRNLTVYSAIGFPEWIVDDPSRRAKGLEEARRVMGMLQEIGGHRVASPPAGATNEPITDLPAIAARYRDLLEVGRSMGITPHLEMWGFSKTLSKLAEVTYVAIAADHPDACVLADIYHLHKGGSGFAGLQQLGPKSVQVFHMNDYPASLSREKITDADRVFPGDGDAPLVDVLKELQSIGFRGFLSLELFNRTYWAQDAEQVARTGLEKLKAVASKAMAG